jgi:hypothetical protein
MNRFVLIGAACILALASAGASAGAHSAKSGAKAHPAPAVWMRVRFARGNVRTAIAYDKTMVTARDAASNGSEKAQGWGFRPVIQHDGSVNVKVYRLRFQKRGSEYKGGKNPRYIETLSPRPAAKTTQAADKNILVRIMKTGPAKKLKKQYLEMHHLSSWNP